MRISAVVCSTLLLASCAPATGTANRPNQETVSVRNSNSAPMAMESGTRDAAHRSTVAAQLDAVWAALPTVLDSLGVPVTTLDPAAHRIGSSGFDVRRTLGRTMVTRYFDCGENRGGSPATSYDLFVTVLTTATTVQGGTQLSTDVMVKGKPISYSGGWVNCESVGLLEQRIADGVTARTHR